jgi:hypothetical protein
MNRDRNDIRLDIDAILANKATLPAKERERLRSLLTQLESAWHDYGYAKGERDGLLLEREKENAI